jgi:hypothetical protein
MKLNGDGVDRLSTWVVMVGRREAGAFKNSPKEALNLSMIREDYIWMHKVPFLFGALCSERPRHENLCELRLRCFKDLGAIRGSLTSKWCCVF